jgi:hypothetical protein
LSDLFPGVRTRIFRDRHEVEDYRASLVTLSVRRLFVRVSGTVKRAAELQSTGLHLKQQQFSSVCGVVAYGCVTTLPFHVANLAFAEVSKRPITLPAVFVPMLTSRGAGNREYQRVFRWRYDAALLLATEFGMDVSAAIVRVPNLKAFDGHWLFLLPPPLNKSR